MYANNLVKKHISHLSAFKFLMRGDTAIKRYVITCFPSFDNYYVKGENSLFLVNINQWPKSERDNAISVKARCTLFDFAVFHRVKPRRVESWTEAIFISRYDSEKGEQMPVQSVPLLRYSIVFRPISIPVALETVPGDISKWIVSSISASSALPKGPFFSSHFIPLLASLQFVAVCARSTRSNMSIPF